MIKLSEPQMEIIDALTEATGIPYQKGQSEIEIPKKLRNYFKWGYSKEYIEWVAKAWSKTNRR